MHLRVFNCFKYIMGFQFLQGFNFADLNDCYSDIYVNR